MAFAESRKIAATAPMRLFHEADISDRAPGTDIEILTGTIYDYVNHNRMRESQCESHGQNHNHMRDREIGVCMKMRNMFIKLKSTYYLSCYMTYMTERVEGTMIEMAEGTEELVKTQVHV